eukprot:4952157-Pyramimonas_sp.AAC.1
MFPYCPAWKPRLANTNTQYNSVLHAMYNTSFPWRCRGLRSPGTLTVGGLSLIHISEPTRPEPI